MTADKLATIFLWYFFINIIFLAFLSFRIEIYIVRLREKIRATEREISNIKKEIKDLNNRQQRKEHRES